ncbi:hypothetical protein T439DRAFT_89636 [Meredithblackwellia eburnea MCA 4105]
MNVLVGIEIPKQSDSARTEEVKAIRLVIEEGAKDNDRKREEALAPQGDSLSLLISYPPQTGAKGFLASMPQRFSQRASTVAWWILEILPMLRVVWDVEGQARRWSIGIHMGKGRGLPEGAVFHRSVLMREEACKNQFPPGDGTSIPQARYRPRAKGQHGFEPSYSL